MTPAAIPLDLEARIARLPCWRGPVSIAPLDGGMTNRNVLVTDQDRRAVVRIGADIPVHGIVRRNELAASRAAHAAGLSPDVIHTEDGMLVLAYIDGRTFTPADVRDVHQTERLAALLRRCHRDVARHLRGPAFMFWVFHTIRDYGHTLRAADAPHVAALDEVAQRADLLERAIGPVEIAFCHNDLLAANIIDDGTRLWLIDWDYAGFNTPLFDLGGLASNSEMSTDQAHAFVEAYLGHQLDAATARRLAAMTAASLLRETLWSMVSEAHSTLDVDFAAYTRDNRARFETAYAAFLAA